MQSCPKRYKLSWEYYDWSVVFKKKRSLQEALSFIWLCLERKHNYHDRQICNFFGFMSASNKIVSVVFFYDCIFMYETSIFMFYNIFFRARGKTLTLTFACMYNMSFLQNDWEEPVLLLKSRQINTEQRRIHVQLPDFTARVGVIAIKVDADNEDLPLSEKGQCYYEWKKLCINVLLL